MKNLINILIAGLDHKRLVSLIYTMQLVLAITIGLQVYQVIDASIGRSVSLEGLRVGNAHMVINDLLNVHGASLSPLVGQIRWMIVIYLIIASFVHAGTWYVLINKLNTTGFWQGGAKYFFRSLLIGGFHLILMLIISALIWIPYMSKIRYWMEYLPNEAPIVWIGLAVFLLWMGIMIYLFLSTSFAKIALIKDEESVFSSLKRGLIMAGKKMLQVLPIFLLFALSIVILYSIHIWVDETSIMNTSFGIFLLFAIQQGIVWLKIALRISVYKYLLGIA